MSVFDASSTSRRAPESSLPISRRRLLLGSAGAGDLSVKNFRVHGGTLKTHRKQTWFSLVDVCSEHLPTVVIGAVNS